MTKRPAPSLNHVRDAGSSEVVTAMTLNAAAALDRSQRLGSIEVGKQADLIVCDVPDYRQLFYRFGVSHVWRVIKRGRVVYAA